MALNIRGAARKGTFWQRHSLSIVLAIILLAQTLLALWTGHSVWVDDQTVHGQPLDYRDFWIWFIWEYNISLVADTFGVILIVMLSKRLEEEGSAESTHQQSSATDKG
jgi:hypothetical protein